ncbi:MAG TPA: hypothetical protein VHD56_14555 [Tepidisphaeraceae bacterium]|nr:hypothetical protein [Tepidisphaeraceae bacterium]
MPKKLFEKDAQALDLLMETGVEGACSESVADRVCVVESVLQLIGQMPVDDPPANLVEKTIARCQRTPAAAHEQYPNHRPPLMS